MKVQSLLLYLFVTAINSFLVFPVLFYPLLIAPLHILIFVLSFDWLLKKQKFKSKLNKPLFAAIPALGQMIIIIAVVAEDTKKPASLLNLLYSLTIVVFFIFFLLEFGILLSMYSKYLRRHNV